MSGGTEIERRALSHHELHLWALQMHVMVNAGVPLYAALELLGTSEAPQMAAASEALADKIAQGYRLSEAMKSIRPSFDNFVVNLVAVGERSGRLVQVFDRVSVRSFQRARTEEGVRRALTYPLFLAAVSGAMAAFMAFYMFPQLLPFLNGLGVPLPWPTRALIWGTTHLTTMLLVGLVLGAWAAHLLSASSHPRVVTVRDWLMYRSPGLGKLNRDRVYADCCNDLSMLIDAQCDLVASLRTLEPAWSEQRERIQHCIRAIRAGSSLTQAVDVSGLLPRWALPSVSSAEETGRLASTFKLLSEQFEEATTIGLERFVKLLEPVIMGGMGVVTGFIVVATFLPLYSMAATSL